MARDQNPEGQLFLFGITAFAIGWWAFIKGFLLIRRRQRIANTPRSKIRSMAMGPVEVQGLALSHYQLKSPISENLACYYSVKIQEWRRSGKSGSWVTLHQDDSSAYEFWVQDETGTVAVRPKGAVLEKIPERTFPMNELSLNAIEYIEQNGISVTGILGMQKRIRAIESCILPSTQVFVLGSATMLDAAMKEERKARIVEKVQDAKNSPEIMKALDTNHDGQVDSNEWDHARAFIERKVDDQLRKEFGNAMIEKSGDQELIISESSERDLLNRYAWKIAGLLFIGPILSFFGFYLVWRQLEISGIISR